VYVVKFLFVLAGVDVIAVVVAMARMSRFISPDAPRGPRNQYAFILKDEHFTDPRGPRLRNQYYIFVGLFVLLCIFEAGAIAFLPEDASL